ncbi:SDR family oxidoreductase [Pseudonocardiaceae bacterium YIM PH 21723]|nr:SDR family oxidoreductase [Pseudonocardiaceae bacterium YIM PH 21723]
MTMIAVTGVTGVTGQLGGRVARRLAAAGNAQRLIVRDASRAPRLAGAEVAVADYRDRDAVTEALTGAGTVLMVSAPEAADRLTTHRSFVEGAVAAGVGHLIYVSFYGASPTATFTLAREHAATEELIRGTGLAYTFLRDNFYADFLPGLAGPDGVIRGPAADGRVAAVAQDDIADAAAAVLGDPEPHVGRTYTLTGPDSLSLHEVAELITTVTGRETRYEAETLEEAARSRAGYNAPDWQLQAWISTYTAMAHGEVATVTGDVLELTGHPPISFEQLLRSADPQGQHLEATQ